MSIASWSRNVHGIADSLRNTERLLQKSGDVVVKAVQENFEEGVNAGKFRAEPATPTSPGEPFEPLSGMTLSIRKRKGIDSEKPLVGTGALMRDIKTRNRTPSKIVVGPKSRKSRFKLRRQYGTDVSGIKSSILKRPVPTRDPMGYGEGDWKKIKEIWKKGMGVGSNSHTKIEIRVNIRAP